MAAADDALLAKLAPFLGPGEIVRVVAWCERANIADAFTAVPLPQRHGTHPFVRELEAIVEPEVLFEPMPHYLVITDRRLILLGTGADDFRAYALADVGCEATRYGERTFATLTLAGHPSEYVLATNYSALLDALPCSGRATE